MAGVFMELIKKQIHMNQWKGNVATQITLDDDFIVPDTMDDMEQVMLDNGEIQAEQVKPMGDKVKCKGTSGISGSVPQGGGRTADAGRQHSF